jgi:Domain of unknown function (DUF4158)
MREFGFRTCTGTVLRRLGRTLLPLPLESDRAVPLIEAALERLRTDKVIAPGITTVEWEIVHMEAVWLWEKDENGTCWPETLRGYYVTFKRGRGGEGHTAVAVAQAEAHVPAQVP